MQSNILQFSKYHGTGNDFIILSRMEGGQKLQPDTIAALCDRHLGIGADGLIELWPSAIAEFKMIYYNADGFIGSMCGNGGRSVAAFAFAQRISNIEMNFEAFDGLHQATILQYKANDYFVDIQMADVTSYDFDGQRLLVDTGSPHFVCQVDNLSEFDVIGQGRQIRHDETISQKGVNVNFIQKKGNQLFMRTYERGVENETLSCGTGVTAAAIAASLWFGTEQHEIYTRGGDLQVKFIRQDQTFRNIHLLGPVQKVFEGKIDINQKFTSIQPI